MSSYRFAIALSIFGISCMEYDTIAIPPKNDTFARIQIEPEFIDFGSVALGEVKTEVLEVSNIGNGVLDIDEFLLSQGAFSFQLPTGYSSLEPGESLDVMISYEPVNVSDTQKMHIEGNAQYHPSLDVPLIGRAAYPALKISPNPYAFDWVEVGSVGEGNITFESIGSEPVIIENTLVLGSVFAKGNIELPFTIPAGESISFPVTFAPEEDQNYFGDLWVQSNAPGPDMKVELHGQTGAGSISGRICDPSGEGWIVGALVSVSIDYNNDGVQDIVIQDYTDAEGRYTLEGVTVGEHHISVQKGSYGTSFDVLFPGGAYEMQEETCLNPASVKVAVVVGDYDNVGGLLNDLEIPFDSYGHSNYMNLLTSPELLAEYDIIFFNCGMPMDWIASRGVVSSNLQDYVADGGSMYASDWAHGIVEATFPYAIEFYGDDDILNPDDVGLHTHEHPYVGASQNVLADVLDPTIAGAIGNTTASLYYDLDAWVLPQSAGPGSSIMLQGSVYSFTDRMRLVDNAPLALQFSAGGRVIYTSFHNEHQMTQDMEKALKEIILSL